MKSLKKNAFLNVIRTVLGLLFPLITFPYSSRILQPEGLGKVNFAFSIITYFSMIGSLGITTYATREAAKRRDNREELNQFAREIFTINITATVIAYILLGISLFIVPKFFEYRKLLIVCSSSVLFTTLGMEWVYNAYEEYTYITIRSIIFQIISLVLLFTIVKKSSDLIQYAIVAVSASVGSNVLNFFHSRKFISFKVTSRLNLKQHLKPIFILFAYSLAASVFTVLDTSMLGFLSNDSQVGYYTVATKLVRMIRDIFPAVFTVLFARIVYYYNNEDLKKFNDLAKKALSFILCFSIPLATGLFILARPIIISFCEESYIDAIPTIRVLSPLILFSGVSGFLGGQILITMGKETTYLKTIIIAAITDLILNFIFIPRLGAFGAGTATMIAEGSIVVIYLFVLHSFLKNLRLIKTLFQFIIADIGMGSVVYFSLENIKSNSIIQLLIPTVLGMLSYGLILSLMHNEFFFESTRIIKNAIKTRLGK